ncbi:MAG: DUF3386 family protein [Gloeomargarita sp. SKYBB_i_bin120]|nr:DUF3386 domain-containing protein [Gloeomargarita sp. SKYB120]MDW8179133.1 DUF3386 family protein [Gloeomargarita sp. SKYBB_i_bin120]
MPYSNSNRKSNRWRVDALLDAREIFRQACENRYTWDAQFPGYQADVVWQSGEETLQAHVRVHRDLSVIVEKLDADHPVYGELVGLMREVVAHRQRRDFQADYGLHPFTAKAPLPNGAVPIQVQDSHYLVWGPVITQVQRVVDNQLCTVDALSVEQTAEGYFPLHYCVQMRDVTTGQEQKTVDVWERHVRVGGYYLLQERQQRVTQDGKIREVTITFHNLKLLADGEP